MLGLKGLGSNKKYISSIRSSFNLISSVQNFSKKQTNGISIVAILIGIVFVLGFTGPAYATIGGIYFDKSLYFYDHGAVITVDDTGDPDLQNNINTGNMQVKLKANANLN